VIWGVTRGPDDVDLETTGLWWGVASSSVAIVWGGIVAWRSAPGETHGPQRLVPTAWSMFWVVALGGAQIVVLVVLVRAVKRTRTRA
jgi:hypothetical protein